jgi:uncharacterized protein (DUF2267 family)
MDEVVVYHSPIKMSPKKRLCRLINGMIDEVKRTHPLVSIEEARTMLGIVLVASRNRLVEQATNL